MKPRILIDIESAIVLYSVAVLYLICEFVSLTKQKVNPWIHFSWTQHSSQCTYLSCLGRAHQFGHLEFSGVNNSVWQRIFYRTVLWSYTSICFDSWLWQNRKSNLIKNIFRAVELWSVRSLFSFRTFQSSITENFFTSHYFRANAIDSEYVAHGKIITG